MTVQYSNVGSVTIRLENVSIFVVRNYLGVLIGTFLDAAVADGVEADANLQLQLVELSAEDATSAPDKVKRLFKVEVKSIDYMVSGYVALEEGVVSQVAATPDDALAISSIRQRGL